MNDHRFSSLANVTKIVLTCNTIKKAMEHQQ